MAKVLIINGRTVRASEANKPDAVSVYDALGNRVAEKVNDVWQFVIYDAFGKLVAEYGGTSAAGTLTDETRLAEGERQTSRSFKLLLTFGERNPSCAHPGDPRPAGRSSPGYVVRRRRRQETKSVV